MLRQEVLARESEEEASARARAEVRDLLALLVQKYEYWRRRRAQLAALPPQLERKLPYATVC